MSFIAIDYFSVEKYETTDKNGYIIENPSKGCLIVQLPGEKAINTGIHMNKIYSSEQKMKD
jgi:hypothetical protein